MKVRLAALLCCAWATGCRPAPTSLALDIEAAAGVTVQSLTLRLGLGSDDAGVSEALPPSGAMPVLPGRAVVRLPDVAIDVAVALDGQDVDGAPLHAATTVRTVPHEQVSASLTLGAASAQPDLAGPVDAGLPCPVDARCNYLYRRQLTIHNGANAALPAGYTVRVPLDPTLFPAAKTRADLADVRVFRDPPAGELPRVVDAAPPGQTRALWIALLQPIAAGASDTSYSVVYGDPSATSPPEDATQVFPFYDGFDSGATPSTARWTTNPASSGAAVGSGTLVLHQNTQEGIVSKTPVPIASVLEWRCRMTAPTSAGQLTVAGTFWWWIGYQNDFTPAIPWILWIQRSGGPVDVQAERQLATSTMCNKTQCTGPSTVVDANYHWYRIERDAANTRWYYDGALSYSVADANATAYPIILRNWAVTSDLVVDWIRGRALASPEPTVDVGGETAP